MKGVGGLLLLCVLLWGLGLGFDAQDGVESLLDARGVHRDVFEQAGEVAPIERTLLVDVDVPGVFSEDGLRLIHSLTEALRSLETVASAQSITHSVMPVRRGFSVEWEPLVPAPPWSEERLEELERFSLGHPLIRNVMVSGDGRRALIVAEYREGVFELKTSRELRDEAQEVLDTFAERGAVLRMVSVPSAGLEIREAVRDDGILFALGGMLLAVLVLRLAFMRWRLAFVVLLAHLIYLSILPGFFRGVGYRPEPFALAVFPLLGAIQLTLLAHIGTAFLRARARLEKVEALEEAIRETGRSCLFAALTTVAGLLALGVSGMDAVRELGLWGAAGVVVGFLFTFGPALSLIALIGSGASLGSRRLAAGFEERWERRAERMTGVFGARTASVLIGAGVALVVSVPGILLLRADVRLDTFVPRGGEVEEIVGIVDAAYGGLQFAQIDIDSGRNGGATERDFLEFCWAVHGRADAIPEVSAVYSYPQVIAVVNQVWHGGDADAYRLPEQGWLLGMFLAGLDRFNLPLLDTLIDDERRMVSLILRMPEMPTEQYLAIVHSVLDSAERRAPSGVEVTAGGVVHEFLSADREIVQAQVSSVAGVIAVIVILLLILWRSAFLAFSGIAVILLPAGIAIGIAGYLGLALNAVTVMAGAIAIGIAADDAVHFVTCWRSSALRHNNRRKASVEALIVKGPPILFTSLILIGIFLVFGLSSFGPVAQLGMLAAGALALTLPAVLVVLPLLLEMGWRGSPVTKKDRT